MLELRVLGTPELAGSRGARLARAHAQPKRVALLTYLALARSRGGHTRDHLLALLWPELDDTHARAALRQAVHHLRHMLGEQAIVAGGVDELRLDPESIACDAVRFEAELDADHPESALALYRGDLLEGFFVSGAPGFQEWLDGERARLRARAASGAWALAECRANAGNVDEAARWGTRALALSHDDEMVLQRLLRLLDQLGDRVRAVLEYEAFARRMQRDYEMEPSTETRHIIDAIRSHISASSPAQAPRDRRLEAERVVATQRPAPPPAATSYAPRARPRPRRVALATIVVLCAGVFVLAAVERRRSPSAVALLDANLVAVAPFETVGMLDSGPSHENPAEWLARDLDDAGSLRTAPMNAVLHAWGNRARSDRASALALARNLDAGLTLFGAISRAGPDSASVTATLVDAATGEVISEQKVTGAENHLTQLLDSMAVALVLDLSTRVGIARPAGSLGSRSLPAIKAFLRGDEAFRRAQWDSAQRYYQQAFDQDSTFALAIRQLGRLSAWRESGIGIGRPLSDSIMLMSSQRASRHARGLGARDSLLILSDSLIGALAPDFCANAAARKRLFAVTAALTAGFPADAEAWVARGDALYVCGGYLALNEPGIDKRQMLQAYDSAIALEPGLALAYDRAFRLALDLSDTARVLRYAAKYLGLNPSDVSASYLRLLTGLLRRPSDAAAILDTVSGQKAWATYASLLIYPDSAELAVTGARRLKSITAPGGTWDVYRGFDGPMSVASFRGRPLALVLAYRGHLRDAAAAAGADRSAFAGRLAGDLAVAGALPRGAPDSAFRAWLHARLFSLDEALVSALAWWGERRDTVALREYLQYAASPRVSGAAAIRMTRYAHHLDVAKAYLALARADTSLAIQLLAALPSNEWWMNERLVLERLLVARGRRQESFAVLDRGVPYPYVTPLHGIWAIEHARLAAQLGQRDKARESYEYVARLWHAADPELQHYVREARAALDRP